MEKRRSIRNMTLTDSNPPTVRLLSTVSLSRHVFRGIFLSQLLLVLGQPAEARALLEEALSTICITHGDQHPYYREVGGLFDQARACG